MSAIDLRLKFLAKSSVILAVSSPCTSAALSAEEFSIRSKQGIERLSDDDPRCKSCGTVDVKTATKWPKQNSASRRQNLKKQPERPQNQKRLLLRTCRRCKRITKHRMSRPIKDSAREAVTQAALESSQHQTQSLLPPDSRRAGTKGSSVSGKKRAKARKEGLQAILEKSKQEARPATTFDLMDFMRST